MSLADTGGTTDGINVGSASQLDDVNVCTFLAWVWQDAASATDRYIYCKSNTAAQRDLFNILGGGPIQTVRGRATSDCIARATQANMSTFAVTKWCFLAAQHSTSGVATDQKLFHGDLQTLAAEAAAYSSQSAGSGTVTSNAAASGFIGNRETLSQSWNGKIAVLAIFNSLLTLADIQSWQFNPRPRVGSTLARGMWNLGLDPAGTGGQPDLAGFSSAATVTGFTQDVHVPLWDALMQRRRKLRRIQAIGRQIMRRVA